MSTRTCIILSFHLTYKKYTDTASPYIAVSFYSASMPKCQKDMVSYKTQHSGLDAKGSTVSLTYNIDIVELVSSTFMSTFPCRGCHGTEKWAGHTLHPAHAFHSFSSLQWPMVSLNPEFSHMPCTNPSAIRSIRDLLGRKRCRVSTIRFYIGCGYVEYKSWSHF